MAPVRDPIPVRKQRPRQPVRSPDASELPRVPHGTPPHVPPAFGGPLVPPIIKAQQRAARKTARAVARQPSPSAPSGTPTDYGSLKRRYDRVPPSQRSKFLLGLPASPATTQLVNLHMQRQHLYREGQVHKARLQAVYGPDATFVGPLPRQRPQKQIAGPFTADTIPAQRAFRQLLTPGLKGKAQAIGTLRDVNVLPGTGPQERAYAQRQQARYRRQLETAVYKTQLAIYRRSGNLAPDRTEVLRAIRGASDQQLRQALVKAPRVLAEGVNVGNLTGLVTGLGQAAAVVGGVVGKGVKSATGSGFAGRLASDITAYPVQAIPAGYMLGKAVIDPAARRQVLHGLSSGVIGHAVRGDLRGAERAFSQHPLFGALEVAGGVGGLTRGVGAGLRGLGAEESALAVRRGLARAGSTRREALDAGGIPVARGYSKDPLRKVGQVAYDKLLAQRVAGTRSYRERHQRQLADYAASRANSAERLTREHQAQFARGAAPTRVHGGGAVGRKIGEILDRTLPSQPIHGKGRVAPKGFYRPERDLVGMVLEGVLRSPKTFVADLRKERARLNAAAADRSQFHDPAELAANRERARLIDRVLADPKAVGNAQGVFKAADEIAPVLQSAERDAVKSGALQPTRVARPKLIPYAIAHMGAKVNPVTEELEINGRRVENGQIRAHMTANGVNPALIQHLPHTLKLRGARAYHRPFGIARLNYEGAQHRTGSLFERGASPNDYTHVLETLVGKHTTLSNIHEFDRLLSNVGVKRPDGQYFTAPEAEAFLRNRGRDSHGNQIPGYQDLTPVRAFSSRGTDLQAVERQQALRSHPDETPLMEQHFANRMNMAGDRGARNVVLVPGTVLEQLRKHIEVGRFRSPKGQAFQSAFRRSVLPFSTKWLFGNTFEAALRNATRGVAPHDPIVARRLFRSMIEQDKHAGNAAQAELSGGLIFGRRGLTVRRTAGEAFGPVGARVAHLPVVKEATGIMREATDGVFALNRVLEREAELAAIGKYTRQRIQELTGSWTKAIRVQQQALDQVAKGLLDTSEQVRLAHYLNETLGQYSRFSPGMRNFIQTYAPFLPWYLNAVRFTAVTLPLHHTLKTAVLTRTEAEFQKDWEAQHKSLGGKAPDLMSAIPHKGGFIDLARFTPFGVLAPIAAGDRSVLASPLLPQITGIQQALLGKDPFGQDLRTPGADGKLRPLKGKEVTWNILNQLVGELAPGFSDYQRLRGAGSTQYPVTSLRTLVKPKTKPGTKHGSALNRVFNPLQPVFLRPQAKGGGKAIDPVDAALKAIDQAHGGTVNNDAVDQALRQIGG